MMLIPGIIIGVIVLTLIMMYNSLIRIKNEVDNAFGGIDVQLKNRYDLIPNLVNTVKQYTSHEKETLENITRLRAKASDGNLSDDEKVALDNEITGSITGLMVAVEAYPDLKASEQFTHLQRSLNEVESQISAARRSFNATITDYNNSIQTFPNSILAGFMNLKSKKVFEIPDVERQNINVGNLFNN